MNAKCTKYIKFPIESLRVFENELLSLIHNFLDACCLLLVSFPRWNKKLSSDFADDGFLCILS